MAIQYVGGNISANETRSGSSYSVSLTALSGGIDTAARKDDLVLVISGITSTANLGRIITGYTQLTDLYSNDTRDANLYIDYKIMGSTPDTSVGLSGAGNAQLGDGAVVMVWRGVDLTTPIDVTTTTATGTDSSQANAPSITPTTSGAVIVACGGMTDVDTPGSKTGPSGMSNHIQAIGPATNNYGWIAAGASYNWSSGSYDPGAWSGGNSSTSDSWCAATVALRPAPTLTTGNFFQLF
jgi:hypothetical protein